MTALFAVADGLGGHTARQGTTLTAMLFSGGRAVVAHIGDSRAFRLRGGRLRLVTEDHTIGNLVATSLAHAGARMALDGRPDRSAGMSLRAGRR